MMLVQQVCFHGKMNMNMKMHMHDLHACVYMHAWETIRIFCEALHDNVVSIYYMVYIIVFFLYIVIHDACVCVFKKYKRHEYYL